MASTHHADPSFLRRRGPALSGLTLLCALYPLAATALLYSEWLLAGWSLGHIPRPALDDPKYIAGSRWLHIFTWPVVVGMVPAAVAALVLTAAFIRVNQLNFTHALVRTCVVMAPWVLLFLLLHWDPGNVLYWFLD